MMAIAHFTIGIIGGTILLIKFPKFVRKYFGNLIKNDIFFIMGSGLFAMLPDINKIIISSTLDKLHDGFVANIFWGHTFIDSFPDTPHLAMIPILIAIFLIYKYWEKIK